MLDIYTPESNGTQEFVKLFDTPWDTNMFMEFIETIVVPHGAITVELALQVWNVASGTDATKAKAIADAFLASEDDVDLAKRWREVLVWPQR